MHPLIGRCPVCQAELAVTRLRCRRCETAIEGHFQLNRWLALPREQLDFAETFIRNRGNIKDVERELGVSYPTVRNRLDALIRALGFEPAPAAEEARPAGPEQRREILDQVRRGELTPEEAARLLRKGT